MNNLLEKRIGSLEKCLPDIEWPDVTPHLIAGQPDQPGRVCHRGDNEEKANKPETNNSEAKRWHGRKDSHHFSGGGNEQPNRV